MSLIIRKSPGCAKSHSEKSLCSSKSFNKGSLCLAMFSSSPYLYHGKTLIDYVSTNRPDCVSDQGVLPYGVSDHDVVYMTRSKKMPRVRMKPKIVEIRKYSKFDSEQFRNDLQSRPFDEIKNITADPNEMWAMRKKFFS